VEDVESAVKAAHTAFESYRKVNPRTRAQWLLKWEGLIREHRDDIATIITYETGKPIAEAQAELDYALTFPWSVDLKTDCYMTMLPNCLCIGGLRARPRGFEDQSQYLLLQDVVCSPSSNPLALLSRWCHGTFQLHF
jgi:hypothetical protein